MFRAASWQRNSIYMLMISTTGRMKEKLEIRENKLTQARKNRIEMRNAV